MGFKTCIAESQRCLFVEACNYYLIKVQVLFGCIILRNHWQENYCLRFYKRKKNHTWIEKPSLTCRHTQNQNRISSVCLRTVLYTHIKSSAKEEPGIRDSLSETIPKWTPVSWRLCWLLCLLPSAQCGVKLFLQDFSEGRQGKTSRLSLPHSTVRTDKSPSKTKGR